MDVEQGHEDAVQSLYDRCDDSGTHAGFAAMLPAFLIYVSGLLPPFVALDAMPQYWGLPVVEFLRQTAAPSGWRWLGMLGNAEYLNLACMALLCLMTLLCYLRIVPALLVLGERLQAGL